MMATISVAILLLVLGLRSVLSICALTLRQRLPVLGASLRLAGSRLVRDSLASARANVVLHILPLYLIIFLTRDNPPGWSLARNMRQVLHNLHLGQSGRQQHPVLFPE